MVDPTSSAEQRTKANLSQLISRLESLLACLRLITPTMFSLVRVENALVIA